MFLLLTIKKSARPVRPDSNFVFLFGNAPSPTLEIAFAC